MTEIKNTTENMSSKNNDTFDIENDQFIETPWNIIGSYFKGEHLDRFVRHQLESYEGGCPRSLGPAGFWRPKK